VNRYKLPIPGKPGVYGLSPLGRRMVLSLSERSVQLVRDRAEAPQGGETEAMLTKQIAEVETLLEQLDGPDVLPDRLADELLGRAS